MQKGLVVRNTGSRYIVKLDENGEMVPCALKGNFRIKGVRTTNPVAVGDHVEISGTPTSPEESAFIIKVEPRRNYIIRRASNLSKESHILASNVDQALLVVTLFHPTTSTTFVDRFLATCEAYNVKALIAINKTDLLADDEEKEYLKGFEFLYRQIGYEVFPLSARTGDGVEPLQEHLKDKITLLSGNSGVGKSTLINCLIPGLDLKTAEISNIHDTGMHTTTFSEMFQLPQGGWLIDTPGVKGFGTIEFEARETDHYFPEIFEISSRCRYDDCSHVMEPGCAVREALENQHIALSRYNSYLSVLEEARSNGSSDKYRKPF